ncbi:murein transglycosylase A [Paludibacterium paludis]|uniref:peptidoglycan lytic exotransglycosylase n=1 Tax=Paludibacterium paludis TaxID=1225769 RepID=A0A918U8K2_9NEIS|nr:MltA domain-containing protein [Paludibacterium paludis]GGY11954.1 membrane-bound lytic murein transglycosylase A [Paludibacterium paludis]
MSRRHALLIASALLGGCAVKTPPVVHTPPRPVELAALPPAADSDLRAGFDVWREHCGRARYGDAWQTACREARSLPDDADAIRRFLEQRMQIRPLLGETGGDTGLITGYYEPVYRGSLTPDSAFKVPVYGVPDDLVTVSLAGVYPELKGKRLRGRLSGRQVVPYDDAATLLRQGAKAPALAWLANPMDLQFLQVQGSGRIRLGNGRELRVGYADQNGHPYRPIGRWLIEQGELKPGTVTMDSIRAWADAHPARVADLVSSNPSYVFFRTLPDSDSGPIGASGVPLTAGYSIASDPTVVPPGSLVWLATTFPDGPLLTRPVVAQDTGGAIKGRVRADLFWGTGDQAGRLAGRMQQPGRMWLFWPRGEPLPDSVAARK